MAYRTIEKKVNLLELDKIVRSPLNFLNVEEYLKLEQDAEIRHEYVAGQIYAMTGSSRQHNLIATNLISWLRPHLHGSSCRAFVSDMKVEIQTRSQRMEILEEVHTLRSPRSAEDIDRQLREERESWDS